MNIFLIYNILGTKLQSFIKIFLKIRKLWPISQQYQIFSRISQNYLTLSLRHYQLFGAKRVNVYFKQKSQSYLFIVKKEWECRVIKVANCSCLTIQTMFTIIFFQTQVLLFFRNNAPIPQIQVYLYLMKTNCLIPPK